MKPPCFNFQDREVGCHGKCERYAEFRKLVDKAREAEHNNALGFSLARERQQKGVAYRQRVSGSSAFWRGK